MTMSPMRLLVIFGPPAVGKMTVGRAVAARSDFRLFHNHATIEPLLDVFDYGTPPFVTLMTEWRSRVVEEAAAFGTDLVFTFEIEFEAAQLVCELVPCAERVRAALVVRLPERLPSRRRHAIHPSQLVAMAGDQRGLLVVGRNQHRVAELLSLG